MSKSSALCGQDSTHTGINPCVSLSMHMVHFEAVAFVASLSKEILRMDMQYMPT